MKDKKILYSDLTPEQLLEMPLKERAELYNDFMNKYATSLRTTINKANKTKQMYNPQASGDMLSSVGGSKYRPPTQQEIEKYIGDPERFSKELRKVSRYFSDSIMQYNRSLDHFKKILTFKYDLRLTTPFEKEDLETVKNGRGRVLSFLRDFNVKYHKDLIMDRVMENGGAFYYLQSNGSFNTLIELPIDYCYVTGRWDRGLTFALDITWFDNVGIMEYQMPELYEYYKTFVELRKTSQDKTKLNQFRYYPVPIEKGFVFTFGMHDTELIPPLTGVFRDANRILTYKNLLMQRTSLDTWKVLGQKIPLDKDTNAPLFSPEQAQVFVDFVQSVLPEGTAVFATPMEFESVDFSGAADKDNIVGRGEELYWRSLGVNGTMMDAGDKAATTLRHSLINDGGYMEQIYTQFENFINLQLRLISRTFIFQTKFYGNRYTDSETLKDVKDVVTSMNAPVGMVYAYLGYEPFEIDPTMELENALKVKEKSLPIVSGYQQGSDSQNGRPKQSEDSLTPSGEATRANDSNARGGTGNEA